MCTSKKLRPAVLLAASLLLLTSINSFSATNSDKRKRHAPSRRLTRVEVKAAEARLREMGYGRASSALVVFQKWEGRKVTGRLSRDDFDVIMNASAPQPKDTGYKHVEIDLDRQVLLLIDDESAVKRILPVSTGSNKYYREKRMSGLAYTPRGRFRVEAKIAGWRKSPLGLLYYPSYFSGGLAIHGNPSVPHNPQSHGCIRIPMSAATDIYRHLPIGSIILIYDQQSFVSAKEWAEADKQKQEAAIR